MVGEFFAEKFFHVRVLLLSRKKRVIVTQIPCILPYRALPPQIHTEHYGDEHRSNNLPTLVKNEEFIKSLITQTRADWIIFGKLLRKVKMQIK
jgi:hypothetical protein